MDGRLPAAGRRLAAVALALLAAPAAAFGADYTVTSTQDTAGGCQDRLCPSIRGALGAAGAGDVIRIPAGEYTQTLGQLVVARDVTIVGAGANRTTIASDPEQGERVLQVGDGPGTPKQGAYVTAGQDAGDVPVGGTVQVTPSVEISHLTMSGGVSCGPGGNLVNYGALRLHHVRVTGGVAPEGGGLANLYEGQLTVEQSLVDGNRAAGCDGRGVGGGIDSETSGDGALVVRDSTVTGNLAARGAGIAVSNAGDSQPSSAGSLERVTLARNRADAAPGGLLIGDRTTVAVRGSLLAENAASDGLPSNCDPGARPIDGQGNLADTDDCEFATADPGLSAALVTGLGETPVLTIPSTSPAVDLAGACQAADQRDVVRPQGIACDAGAFEVAAPAIDAGPAGATGDASPTFAFSADQPQTAFECRLDGPGGTGVWESCRSPKTYAALAAGGYAFSVRGEGASAQVTRTFTVAAPPAAPRQAPAPPAAPRQAPAPVPTATPQPRFRRSVVVKPTNGTVRVRRPGAKKYVELDAIDGLPLGSSIDVRKGRVRLYAARDRRGRTQAASFYGGVFRVVQRGSVIELALRGPRPVCGSRQPVADAAQAKHRRKARKRRLWGSGRGKFRTKGRYSSATIRGTTWLVEDSCHSTTTRVKHGVVKVRDFKRRRTILLRAGNRYVARRAR